MCCEYAYSSLHSNPGTWGHDDMTFYQKINYDNKSINQARAPFCSVTINVIQALSAAFLSRTIVGFLLLVKIEVFGGNVAMSAQGHRSAAFLIALYLNQREKLTSLFCCSITWYSMKSLTCLAEATETTVLFSNTQCPTPTMLDIA